MLQENRWQSSHWRLLSVILLITLTFLFFFRDKAFHIDDVYFLEVAENIMKNPMDPFHGATSLLDDDFRIFKKTGRTPNTFDVMSHPPLVSYIQAAVASLTGGFQERCLHLTFIIFPLLCMVSTYFLAMRFTDYPIATTSLFIATPLFLVNATNLMTDIPMLGLGLTALAFFVYGTDHERIFWLLLAGFFTGLAILTRYIAVGLLVLFLAYVASTKKGFRHFIWVLGPVFTIVGLWLLENYLNHGALHLIASSKHYAHFYGDLSFSPPIMLQKLISGFAAIGGAGFFGFFVLLFGTSNKKSPLLLYIAAAGLSFILLVVRPFDLQIVKEYSLAQTLLLLLFVSIGFFFFLCTFQKQAESRDKGSRSFLMIWFLGALAASILLLPFGTGRYVLPTLLPLIFILSWRITSASKLAVGVVISFTLSLSILLTVADYQHAVAYKNFANNLKQMYPGSKIWFVGDWGFRFYMKRNGYQYLLSSDDSPNPGDLIVKAQIAGLHNFSVRLQERCSLLKRIEISSELPVRLMNFDARTGFYSHGFGFLPFGVSRAPLERFDIYRVDGTSTKF